MNRIQRLEDTHTDTQIYMCGYEVDAVETHATAVMVVEGIYMHSYGFRQLTQNQPK